MKNGSNRGLEFEALRQLFRDDRVHSAIGIVKQVDLASDKSVLRLLVRILPEKRDIVAKMAWDATGESAGIFQFPEVDDLVMVLNIDGDEENAFVIKQLTSKSDKIPAQAADGSTAVVARSGKFLWLTSDTAIYLSKGDDAPAENLVLGQVLKTMLSTVLEAIAEHTHIDGMGAITTPPSNAATYTAQKASPVDDEAMLSDIAFTEKGD